MDKLSESQQKVAKWLQRWPDMPTDQFYATTYAKVISRPRAAKYDNGGVVFTTVDGGIVRTTLDKWDDYKLTHAAIDGNEPVYSLLVWVITLLNKQADQCRRWCLVEAKTKKYTTDGILRAIVSRYIVYCFSLGDRSPNDMAGLHKAVAGATSYYLSCIDFSFEATAASIINEQDRQLIHFINALCDIGVSKECSVAVRFDLSTHKYVVVTEWDENCPRIIYRGDGSYATNDMFLIYVGRIDMILSAIADRAGLYTSYQVIIRNRILSDKWIADMLTWLVKKDQETIMFGIGGNVRNTAMAALARYIAARLSA